MPRFASRPFLFTTALVLALAVVAGNLDTTEAHKAVTSPYTYNNDIFPILRDNCGRCHVEGGPAPMGLLAWNDGPNSATPWAESIRQLVVGEQMPPWYVDSRGPAVKGGFALTPAQSDKLLTWATGGTPEGDPEKKPGAASYQARWTGGSPDLKLAMESEYTMPASDTKETKEFVLSTGLKEQRWVRAVDLLPGAPEIVRNASISLENGAVLAVWVPGDNLVSAPAGTAFRLPASAKLRLQIHYKKQWQNEGKVIKDRSTVGLYFTTPPASGREIQSFAIDRSKAAEGAAAFSGVLSAKARVVAVRPSLDRVYGAFTVQAITPAGARVPLLRLRTPRPEWRRRYWLVQPVDLPAGSRIEVTTTSPSAYIELTGAQFMKTYPLQVALDFVPAGP
jgi:hypothetical protein